MSSEKSFEKTFSRKKKDCNTTKKKKSNEKEVVTTPPKSPPSHSHGQPPPTTIIYALMSSSTAQSSMIKKKKKNKDENRVKDEKTLKRKIENGKEEKEVTRPKKTMIKEKEDDENCECAFPTTRVLRIVKSEGSSDYKLSAEAVFLINKATEKFIEVFSRDAYATAVEGHKSFVAYKHLASVVCKEKRMDFLSDFVPEKVTAEKALAEIKPAETLPG